jgi:acetoacetyl-CoA synthetase
VSAGAPLWIPSERRQQEAELTRYLAWLTDNRSLTFTSYADLHRWSVDDLTGFWGSLWSYFQVVATAEPDTILSQAEMPGAHWFDGARLNYAGNALRGPGSREALVGISEGGAVRTLTYGQLRAEVAAVSSGLRDLGVVRGDRVAVYLPNVIEAVSCLLACAAVGAVFCICPPEFGPSGALARLARIRPKVLIAADGYEYGGRAFHRLDVVRAICAGLPTLQHLVILPVLGDIVDSDGPVPTLTWADLRQPAAQLVIDDVPFEHPLWVLFSSGTTGKPKAIVHGHGGIVLEHLKSLTLHRDVRAGDRVMWLTSAGWMMWNYIVGSLLVGATVILFDGSPAYPDLTRPWEAASAQAVNLLGAGAGYLEACRKAGLRPGESWDLHSLRSLGSTGSALPGPGYDWVYEAVKADVMLSPASGGTDVCSAFLGPCPLLPLWREEMQCRMLGASVEAYDSEGRPLVDQVGELVLTRPMPSMPLYLWDDPGGEQLRESYFSRYDGTWDHGDWVVITSRGSARVLGRSDATLNRGGIRMGTEDYYAVLGQRPEISDSLIIDVATENGESELILFVVPASGVAWSDKASARIRAHIRAELSPRHVPDHVYALTSVPRTLSGKRLEVPVKRIMAGEPLDSALSLETVANPNSLIEILDLYRARNARPVPHASPDGTGSG